MSRPRHNWYSIVVKVLRNYPDLYRRHEEAQQQRTTATYTGMPGGGGVGRKTEAAAIRGLTPREEDDLNAVLSTIRTVSRWREGKTALRVVELVDWQKTHTIEAAARSMFLSKKTAERLRSRVVYELAKNMRYR